LEKFKELYEHCQKIQIPVSRKDIQPKALSITGATRIAAVKSTLDTDIIRGYFLSASNTEARLVQQFGCNVIVLARSLNYCWERFVFTKELMHLFDLDDEKTSNTLELETLLSNFEIPDTNGSKQFKSDIKGLWMALACLCPESERLKFKDGIEKGHIDYYGIALQIKIPEKYVKYYFTDAYERIIKTLLA